MVLPFNILKFHFLAFQCNNFRLAVQHGQRAKVITVSAKSNGLYGRSHQFTALQQLLAENPCSVLGKEDHQDNSQQLEQGNYSLRRPPKLIIPQIFIEQRWATGNRFMCNIKFVLANSIHDQSISFNGTLRYKKLSLAANIQKNSFTLTSLLPPDLGPLCKTHIPAVPPS